MSGKPLLRCLTRPVSHTRILPFIPRVQNATKMTKRTSNGLDRFRQKQEQSEEARAMEKNFSREWNVGDVYAPHDLSAAEARKWKSRKAPTTDAFDFLSLNPLDLYKNFSVMSEYVTEMGRIKPRSQTGLRPVNQRRIAKAIRRAIAFGLMPSSYRHPELLKHEMRQAANSSRDFYAP